LEELRRRKSGIKKPGVNDASLTDFESQQIEDRMDKQINN